MAKANTAITPFQSKGKQTKAQNKLSELWQKVEKNQQRNQRLEHQIDELFATFKELALEAEQEYIAANINQCEHLATFLPKKSLTNSERDVLQDWIDDLMVFLQSHPFIQPNQLTTLGAFIDLQQSLHEQNLQDKISADDVAAFRLILQERFEGINELGLSDEQIRHIMLDPANLLEHLDKLSFFDEHNGQETPFDYADENEDEDWDDDAFEQRFFNEFFKQQQQEHDYTEQIDEKDNALEKLFKGSKLNKMYKRLAQKLHPDKAVDDADRVQKHKQMQELAHARKTKDAFSILQLYLQHFDDDPDLDEATLKSLKPLLEAKIKQLNHDYNELRYRNDAKTLVWRRFKQSSKQKTEAGIRKHAITLNVEASLIRQFKDQCPTLKALKVELKQKRLEYEQEELADILELYESEFGFEDDFKAPF